MEIQNLKIGDRVVVEMNDADRAFYCITQEFEARVVNIVGAVIYVEDQDEAVYCLEAASIRGKI